MNTSSFASRLTTLTGALLLAGTASALTPRLAELDDDLVEAAFWDCDVAATRYALSGGDGAICAALADELKRRRFDGDLERLLGWWRAHKDAKHALRAAVPAAADDPALQAP